MQLLVSGMHLSSEFGETYKQIEIDGFTIDEKIEILKSFPEMGKICEFKPLLRQLLITKHITLFHEVENRCYLLALILA